MANLCTNNGNNTDNPANCGCPGNGQYLTENSEDGNGRISLFNSCQGSRPCWPGWYSTSYGAGLGKQCECNIQEYGNGTTDQGGDTMVNKFQQRCCKGELSGQYCAPGWCPNSNSDDCDDATYGIQPLCNILGLPNEMIFHFYPPPTPFTITSEDKLLISTVSSAYSIHYIQNNISYYLSILTQFSTQNHILSFSSNYIPETAPRFTYDCVKGEISFVDNNNITFYFNFNFDSTSNKGNIILSTSSQDGWIMTTGENIVFTNNGTKYFMMSDCSMQTLDSKLNSKSYCTTYCEGVNNKGIPRYLQDNHWCNTQLQTYCNIPDHLLNSTICQNGYSQNRPGGNGKTPSWADVQMTNTCKKFSNLIQDSQPEICGCLLSQMPVAGCVDPRCTNAASYKPANMVNQSINCPNICLDYINVNKTGGNVIIDNNTFKTTCNTTNGAISKYYNCDNNTCVESPDCSHCILDCQNSTDTQCIKNCVDTCSGPSKKYKDDNTCGGECVIPPTPPVPIIPTPEDNKNGTNFTPYIIGGFLLLFLIFVVIIFLNSSVKTSN